VIQLVRAIRYHIHKFLNVLESDLITSQLGLGHSYSREKCKFDVNRDDKPIIQSIALIDQLDKNINSFCMRIKEWFGWHFPELARIISDNYVYVRIVKLIETRNSLVERKEELQEPLEAITLDVDLAKQIFDASTSSMGSELGEMDLANVKYFCEKVAGLIKYREELLQYLRDKMKKIAPNVSALVGETVAARLISHAGSLVNLAKYPASTIQILGAEKALFRALKTRGKTPKYGLLYHSSFIGKAQLKNKGKISRYLANKLAMCSRIDFFSTDRYEDFGNELKNQVEERLKFLSTGIKPRKNIDVMKEISEKVHNKVLEEGQLLKKKTKKKKSDASERAEMNIKDSEQVQEKSKKKKKQKVVDEDEE
jgi:nucleolar protein 56